MPNILTLKRFSGQLGNHLFQANLLCQVADEFEAGSYFRSSVLRELFTFKSQLDLNDISHSKGIVKYSTTEIEGLGFSEWMCSLSENFKRKKMVLVEPGVMGSIFFESCLKNPKELISLKRPKNYFGAERKIGIHFRAGDFKEWNPNAILPASYYMNSLDYLESIGLDISNSYLATDDVTHPTSIKIANRIGQILDRKSNPGRDFHILSNSQYLISSPSTFAFWAAILGNEVRIIHNRDWLNQNEAQGVKFWIDIRKNCSSFYKVFAEI